MMNRRGFAGAALAGIGGLFFPQKAESSVNKGQYLVTIDIDEDRMFAIQKKLGKKYKISVPGDKRRAIEELLRSHLGIINRWHPGIIDIEVVTKK